MFKLMCFCCALVSANVAFGQQQQRGQVNGVQGTYVFVPDSQRQIAPTVDPAFQQPTYQEQQTVVPRQQVVVQQGHQHAGNCGCPICKRTLLQRSKAVKSKTITEVVTTEVFQDEHPVQFFNESPPPQIQQNQCQPRNPCIQPRNSGGMGPYGPRFTPSFVASAPVQKQCCVNLLGLVRISATSGPAGYAGGQQRYYGDSGYGGLGYSSQPVRPW